MTPQEPREFEEEAETIVAKINGMGQGVFIPTNIYWGKRIVSEIAQALRTIYERGRADEHEQHHGDLGQTWCAKAKEAELRAAYEKGIHYAESAQYRDRNDEADQAEAKGYSDGQKDGYARGVEDAASEADLHNGCIDPVCLNRSGQCGVTIAERIRALLPQGEGKETT